MEVPENNDFLNAILFEAFLGEHTENKEEARLIIELLRVAYGCEY